MTTVTLYGIMSCGSVKKALAWAKAHDVTVNFVDLKTVPITRAQLESWLAHGAELTKLVNKSSTTWRSLSNEDRVAMMSSSEAIQAQLLKTPLLIKRPVIEWPSGQVTVGVDEEGWTALKG